MIVTASLATSAWAKFDAGLINISLGNKEIVPEGKAVLGADGDKWNAPDGDTGEKIDLTDAKGEHVDVTLTFNANGKYDADNAGFVGTAWEKLLRHYVYTIDPLTVTLSGLTANAKYDLILYSASNTDGRKTKFTIGTESKTTTYVMDKKELEDGVNYAKFTATADADGTLTITFEGVDGAEGNLNGLQITPTAK